jgi:predicted RNA-binding Zn ribbon-like protein
VTTKEAAPGGLEVIRQFVNTRNIELDTDALDSAATLTRWLGDHDLLEGDSRGASEADFRRARDLREALRTLLLENTGAPANPSAYEALSTAGSRGRYALGFGADRVAELQPTAKGVDGALARLVGFVYEAQRDGVWDRLKACRDATCEFAFYDKSKNRSATWCSMDVCGNRNKVRLFRTRACGEAE